MPSSVWSPEIQQALDRARRPGPSGAAVFAEAALPAPFPSPVDWRDVWIYQILVDRFNNPAAPPRAAWDAPVNTFQGGTLDGIRRQLDYLKELGVGALWLTPVLKNCQYNAQSYHGYGIQDFLSVDPRFGSTPEQAESELRALIDQAHARGIYVIFDIVLNHAGDVFEYDGFGGEAPWRDLPYPGIRWRDENGAPRPDWTQAPSDPAPDAAIWPEELRENDYFLRQGNAFSQGHDPESGGDFFSLKQFNPNYQPADSREYPLRDALIRTYQYLIARFDIDGYRIDTLKYLPRDFARVFGNAIREYALSIGKENFFTFGEVYDDETKIAAYIGRNACSDDGDLVGVDAALDFPLFFKLPQVIKGFLAPSQLAAMYEYRKQVERGVLSSHGEASRYFVTFLDNHDQTSRIYYSAPGDPHRYDEQVAVAAGCLFALQGIPCIYYGTEQGLHGAGGGPEAVREALWGKPGAFDRSHPFYRTIRALAELRAQQPALRYGRQYFRPLSGDDFHFAPSDFSGGVIAFSRILQYEELLVVANTNANAGWSGSVLVDPAINAVGDILQVLYSNKAESAQSPGPVEATSEGIEVHETNGSVSSGPVNFLRVSLQPMEIQVLGQMRSA